ncbi:lysine 2,3-aminomutase, partial [Pseudomonas paracarnis]|nr:lysine 2,3-aminomutase [Pseudomonas paracarnis]
MSIFDQAMHRSVQWQDWRWQQKNAIRDEPALRNACGGWDEATTAHIEHNLQDRKMQITPYYIDLIKRSLTSAEVMDHPLWRQVVPYWSEQVQGDYDGSSENWEL